MSFINFLNYKKYFGKNTDAQAARIGHVNAAYKDLKITTGSVTQLTDLFTNVELNTLSGKIILADNLVTITSNQFSFFALSNSNITANSIILLQVTGSDADPSNNPYVYSVVSFIEEGACKIIVGLSENGQVLLNPVVNFLIINP